MANPFFLLDPADSKSTADAEWQAVVQNGVQPELSGILKRVSSSGGREYINNCPNDHPCDMFLPRASTT